tara:strand:- start:34 stop:663 length:630 start_codon:yes stop_codon:yes gene_type:complete
MKTIEVLAQTIYEFEADQTLLNTTLELVKKEELLEKQCNSEGYQVTGMTKNLRLHLKPEYADVTAWIYECLDELRRLKNLQCDKFTITQCWGTAAKYNTHQFKHYHTNSYISGIFYLTKSNTGTTLYHNDIWKEADHPLVTVRHLLDDRQVTQRIPAKAGKLILFPSSLFHEVKPSRDLNDRHTLVINAFPSGKIGDFRMFNGIELEIK